MSDGVFRYLDRLWDPHDVDRFADDSNTKCSIFNSFYWCPGTSGVDAFNENWENYNNWLVPPISLIPETLEHLRRCGGSGTLVVPKWPSAAFWPLILDENREFGEYITDYIEYKKPKKFFNPHQTSVFGEYFNSNVLVLPLQFPKGNDESAGCF